MAQQFLIVGNKAYRDAMDAVTDPNFVPGKPVKVEFETPHRINDFFHLTLEDGTSKFVRSFDEILEIAGPAATVRYTRLFVFPFIERKERADKGVPRKLVA